MDKLEFKKQPEKGSVTCTIRMSDEVNNKLNEIVEKTGMSKNMIINSMIQFGLEHYEIME